MAWRQDLWLVNGLPMADPKDKLFSEFYSEVKLIEKRDAALTPKQQIDRLNRPGCTYFNLNPFDVLQIDPDVSMTDIKSRYRQVIFSLIYNCSRCLCLCILIKIKTTLSERRRHLMVCEKRRRSKGEPIDEDDPAKYKHAVYVQTCKLFADLERLRVDEETKQTNERKRKAEEDELNKYRSAVEREWRQNYEDSRNDRIASWRDFRTKKAKKHKNLGGLKPPKTKMEQRPS
ncbi:unnamed protein product [Schistocephalus solidus]|uniref:J domain-containing protein n=1 Tax=Schistocephalus solidus TaxID=70667 RepID=A0A183TJN6_SCHSO|nr:unnamed protein product [Schistocephalus solidus]